MSWIALREGRGNLDVVLSIGGKDFLVDPVDIDAGNRFWSDVAQFQASGCLNRVLDTYGGDSHLVARMRATDREPEVLGPYGDQVARYLGVCDG